jgi:hypothetical protein
MADDGSCGPAPRLDELARRRLIEELLRAAAAPAASAVPAPRWRRAALAAGVLAALGGALALGLSGQSEREPRAAILGPAAQAPLLLRAGAATIDGRPAGDGDGLAVGQLLALEQGRAVLRLPSSKVLVGARSGVVLRALSAARVELELRGGELLAAVERRAPGQEFVVATAAGRVLVRGTLFRLRAARGSVELAVFEGRVRVELVAGDAREVSAGQRLSLAPGALPALLSDGERAAAERERRLFALLDDEGQAAARVESAPGAASVSLDGAALGETPLVAALRAGRRRLVIAPRGRPPESEELELARGDVVLREVRLAQAPPTAAASQPAASDRTIVPRLRQQVDELKEQALRSKLRLEQLKEALLHERVLPRQVTIVHRHALGRRFRVERIVYSLDGKLVLQRSGELDRERPLPVLEGPIAAGAHTVSVQLVLRGNGWRVFPYFEGYRFNVRSSYSFVIADNRHTRLTVTAFENGGPLTAIEQLPALRFELKHVGRNPGPRPADSAAGRPDQ